MNASDLTFDEMTQGLQNTHDYTISEDVYTAFLAASGDRSPIHVDEVSAKAAGFEGCVMHGSILNAFISHFVGMVFPGKHALLLGVNLRYANPSYLGDMLRVSAQVVQRVESQSVIEMNVVIENITRGVRAASGKILSKVRAP